MKQTNDIDTLLKLAFEAEGLLLMLKDRGKDMPAEALALLADKTAMLQAGVMEPSPLPQISGWMRRFQTARRSPRQPKRRPRPMQG